VAGRVLLSLGGGGGGGGVGWVVDVLWGWGGLYLGLWGVGSRKEGKAPRASPHSFDGTFAAVRERNISMSFSETVASSRILSQQLIILPQRNSLS